MKSIYLEAKREPRTEKIKGIDFIVSVSPYFFPERLDVNYDRETGCLIVDFKYLDDEPSIRAKQTTQGPVSVLVGAHSGKLASLHIHVDDHGLDRVNMLLTDAAIEAINEVEKLHPDLGENYELAREAISQHREEIAEVAVTA